MLSFEEKIMALGLIRAVGLSRAVAVVARHKKLPSPTIREELDQIDSTHYLLDEGFVEKTGTGIIQYVQFSCPQQPSALTKEYFDRCKKPKQDMFLEALAVLNVTSLLRNLRPAPIVKKVRHAEEAHASQ
jgi:hypothetical protein